MSLTEIRKDYRIGPFSAFDLLGTVFIGFVLYKYEIFSDSLVINELSIFGIGVMTHKAFDVKTPLNTMIENNLLK